MLLEQLVEKGAQPPQYDWDAYYRWFYSTLAGREVSDCRYWLCQGCMTVNLLFLPARYGKCRNCQLLYLP